MKVNEMSAEVARVRAESVSQLEDVVPTVSQFRFSLHCYLSTYICCFHNLSCLLLRSRHTRLQTFEFLFRSSYKLILAKYILTDRR